MPVTALVSGEPLRAAAGGGGQTQLAEELDILLIQLVEAVLLPAQIGDPVELHQVGGHYEAYLAGNRFGTVPSHYTAELASQSRYRGRLIERVEAPLKAMVRVRLHV